MHFGHQNLHLCSTSHLSIYANTTRCWLISIQVRTSLITLRSIITSRLCWLDGSSGAWRIVSCQANWRRGMGDWRVDPAKARHNPPSPNNSLLCHAFADSAPSSTATSTLILLSTQPPSFVVCRLDNHLFITSF